ncbi:heme exporter protein CcmB [Inhella sp.]|uniref:heme exporter protein CcmB n=1 Tax=Inhella sp. TaxID=1921806 RepID=UPI0035AF0B5F
MSSLTLLSRELRLTARRPLDALMPLAFFLVAASLFPLGIGPEPERLREIAPGVLWVVALFSTLLSLHRVFEGDWADGTLDQLLLPPQSALRLASVKALAHWLTQGLPLLLVAPLLALMFGLGGEALGLLMLTLLLGTPVLSLLGTLSAALTLGLRNGAVLNLLINLPLAVPVLIFGSGAVAAQQAGQAAQGHLALLGALFLITLVFAPLTTAAALKIAIQ